MWIHYAQAHTYFVSYSPFHIPMVIFKGYESQTHINIDKTYHNTLMTCINACLLF